MKYQFSVKDTQQNISESISKELEVDVLENILRKIYEENIIKTRVIKYKLEKYIKSDNPYEKLYAVNKVINDGKGIEIVPNEKNYKTVIRDTNRKIADILAKRYVQNKIEKEVETAIEKKQEKYIEEVRLSIIKKEKGPENANTLRKYAKLEVLDRKQISKNIQAVLRPEKFSEIIGQDRAIKSLISKMCSPYPQHVILYGPPGVGKTTAARIALEEAKRLKNTPFSKEAKFVEVNGATLRWDPREITNPLLGSVHDPIYQGTKRDLAETGIPEPKTGLVTEAHGGVLFIDEIGELDEMLQNKLLKVLEDKRVGFSSSYYDPDDPNVPKYVKYLFEKGAPADFVLIGATTKEPYEINPALRSRCTEVYFEPLDSKDIQKIVKNAARKLKVKMEAGVPELISRYSIEGRRAINILADAYGYVLYNNGNNDEKIEIKIKDIEDVISIGRLIPFEEIKNENESEIGHVYGLGVSGFLGSTIEIEAAAFKSSEDGKGHVRFNDTAGSMAKDSVFNAASVIKKVAKVDIDDYDIHVNAVGGGNIDGPSAGAAITTCILSAILNKPIRQDIAITGEISLRGKIKPVGGISEKIYGARRKGIKEVLLPEENFKEVPLGITDIKISPCKTIEDVIDKALIKK